MNAAKRITFKRNEPNPLFREWLQEMYDEAEAKGSKLQTMLRQALDSLSKYPVPLNSGSECAILKGFGKKLCLFLDKKLEEYDSSRPLSMKNIDQPSRSTSSESNNENLQNSSNIERPAQHSTHNAIRKKPYKPKYRSGGYAILVALLNHLGTNPVNISLTKDEIIERAQPLCEESFVRRRPESFYTAWSSMSLLVKKGLITRTAKRKVEFKLTDEGLLLATELLRDNANKPTANDVINQQISRITGEVDNVEDAPIETDNIVLSGNNSTNDIDSDSCDIDMPAGSFDIILLIDKQETTGTSKKNDPTVAQFNKYPDLKHEYRHLKVGDFTWIARHKENKDQELVLPYIVERKRMDDLGSSIKDGRFHEQKFRLRKCAIPNVIYLIENYGSNKYVGLPIRNLMQAIANTRVQDGFKVHITDSLTKTARFLAILSKRLSIEFKNKCLKGKNHEPTQGTNELMTFTYFNKSSVKSKTLTVKETFIKLLIQLKGVSVEKALAITEVYQTPKALIAAYSRCSEKEGEMLLANLTHSELNRNVGPSVSKSLYQLFTITNLL